MEIIVKAMSPMKKYFKEGPVTIKMISGATLEDFFVYFHNHLSRSLPDFFWNTKKKRFRGPIIVMLDNKVVTDPKTPLEHGNSIKLFKALVGG